ncbi:MAG: tetraacyldisaccharide 4'-kinase [Rhizobiaceae bacterium]
MASEAPPFWWEKSDWRAWSLLPLSAAYGAVAGWRMNAAQPEKAGLPVLCVGNFTVGGAGKTPVAIALARAARERGLKPGILSRGHGGTNAVPKIVDLAHDSARSVGDEPLLLARHAPVAVSVDRPAGVKLLIEAGADFLIMDDGFQSRRIATDYALIVVDAMFGLGNGHVIPAGPLRAPLAIQLRYTDAVLALGEGDGADAAIRLAARAGKPVHAASISPSGAEKFAGLKCLAYAGIGHPEKFYQTLAAAGAEVAASRAFPDHHPFSDSECEALQNEAAHSGLVLVTTAKDAVRLVDGTAAARSLLAETLVLEIEAQCDDPGAPARIIAETLERFGRRR